MAKIIEARVIQKVATEAEWLNVALPLYQGEIALVRSGDRVVNMKVGNGTAKFSELNYVYNGGFNGSINPSTATGELQNGFYFTEVSGTYNNAGNIVVKEGYYTILEKYSGGWKKSTEVKMPMQDLTEINQKIDKFNRILTTDLSSSVLKKNFSLSATLTISGTGTMHLYKVNGGDELKVTRPSVQGNRFRIVYFTSENEPRIGSAGIDVYNNTSNDELSHTFVANQTATYIGVYLSSVSFNDNYSTSLFRTAPLDLNGKIEKEYVKRSFIFDEPVNLLDGTYISNKNISITGMNQIQDSTSVNSRLMVAEIENGETYTVTKFEGGNTFRVATVDTYPDASGSTPIKHLFFDNSITSQERSHTFTNTENAKFVVLQSSNNIFSGELPLMQVEKGSVKTEFHEYGKLLKVKEKYISNDFLEDIGKQPIEGVDKLIGVSFATNVPPDIIAGSANVNSVSYRVKLKPFERITIRRVVGNRFYLATRNTPNPIEYVRGEYYPPQPTDNLIVNNPALTKYDFVNNGTAVELWMYAYGSGTDPESVEVIFERTESDVTSKSGYRLIADALSKEADYAKKGYTERTLAEVEAIALSNSSALKRKVSTLYTTEDAVVFPTMPTLLDFYDKYDSLVADNPDYISKQVLGQDSQGNDIVQYTFKPVPMKGEEDIIIPKIGITTGTHGNEKPAAYALYNTMNKIASRWRWDEVLENFRYNYEFVIIPVVTPSAFINNSRNNINGININRDFPSEASGSSAGRELETQIVMQFLADNSDIDLFIDYHTDGYYPETNEYAYLRASDEGIREAFKKSLVGLSSEWRSIYPSVTQDDNVVFASLRNEVSTTLAYYASVLGLKSGILETMNNNYISTPEKSRDEITQIMDVEVLMNLINGYFKLIQP